MLVDAKGSANSSGNVTITYRKDEMIDCKEDWQVALANAFVEGGLAMEVKIEQPKETKAKKKTVKKKTTKKKG